tara:strand:+ start:11723 stop:11845 length:123 start_codon:yes stop_codon:yes gene_type:complete
MHIDNHKNEIKTLYSKIRKKGLPPLKFYHRLAFKIEGEES